MVPLVQAVITVASTLVSADRMADTDVAVRNAASGATAQASTGEAIYTRGKSEFATALDQVEPNPVVLQALGNAGKLAKPDTSLDAMIQAAAQPASPTAPSPLPGSMAAIQKSLQDGGQQLYQASRLGLKLDHKT